MHQRMMGYPLVLAFAAFIAGVAMVEPILRWTGVLASPAIYAEPNKQRLSAMPILRLRWFDEKASDKSGKVVYDVQHQSEMGMLLLSAYFLGGHSG